MSETSQAADAGRAPTRAYGFGTTIAAPYAEAVERAKAALKEQGFGVLTEIDVEKTMREKLGAAFRPYVILGACNPPLAHRALEAEPDIGLLLPCNVVVYAADREGRCVVAAMDPEAALELTGNERVRAVAREVRGRLERVRDKLR